jgi:hypothetical protein
MVHRRPIASLRITLPVALAMALAACDEAPQTVSRHVVDGAWDLAQGAMQQAPLLVIVEGNPFQTSAEHLETSVIEIMTGAVTWTATPRFTTEPAEAVSQSLRIVMTFNPPDGTGAHEQCTGQSSGGGPLPEERVRVLGTFCDAATILVTVSGRLADAAELDDPRVAALVRQVTLDMLSPQRRRP